MEDLRIQSVLRGEKITIRVNGQPVVAYEGESVHAALLAAGHRVFRQSRNGAGARGIFCGMGVCYECLVTINGVPNRRACMCPVEDGMEVVIHGQ
ncbi:proline dehydrogenase [Desulfonema ishimotonii]|uniref:Proline dehydrogenase n=2 Tax=Desulfonema ishimotonii TaxID=45657 RepID=A0A401G1X7_9BACT|nr:proline dehydrogenase [Desulfonema ishimotonii]